MFKKKLENGRYRYYEKYYDKRYGKWKQVSVTLTSKSRQAQGEAKRILDEKILLKQEALKQDTKITIKEAFDEWLLIRKTEVKVSTIVREISFYNLFIKKFGSILINDILLDMEKH
ncbi:hypothetical protein EA438_08315 [Streptococcus dysgalactiae subsp. dysgalactiae]|nr:hypothetical protein [Streptococcus dysgalactiae subsp. dysgalactiae]